MFAVSLVFFSGYRFLSCLHNQMTKPSLTFTAEPPLEALKASFATADSPYRPLQILFDTSNLNASSLSDAQKSMITSTILPKLGDWVKELLEVNGPTTIPPLEPSACSDLVNIPSAYTTTPTTADLLVFVTAENNKSVTYVAQATACVLSAVYPKRPVVGFIGFNAAYMPPNAQSMDQYVRVSMHEMLHVLAISGDLFAYFNGYAPGEVLYQDTNRMYLRTPAVRAFVQQHFGCAALQAAPLEDEGGAGSAGSHFERTTFGNEMMTSQIGDDMPLTGLSLAVLADSGWYKVNQSSGEQFWWGRGAGCTFYGSLCKGTFAEFCKVPAKVDCTGDYRSGSQCSSNTFANSCFIKPFQQVFSCDQIYPGYTFLPRGDEKRGPNSRCFSVARSTGSAFGCFPSQCTQAGTITFQVKNSTFTCDVSGKQLTIGTYKVICPDIKRFCSFMSSRKCTNDCSGYGYCRENGTCKCRVGFKGENCLEKEVV